MMIARASQTVGPDSVGWGILGTGARAREVVAQAIRQQPPTASNQTGAWVVGVYSHSERRANAFAEEQLIPHSYPNLADLLQRHEVQSVYIASHPRHHFPLAMAALTAGKHVLVEAPMALTLDEAQSMAQAAEHRGLLLAVSHPRRADPAVQQLKLLLADEFIGDLLGCHICHTVPLAQQQQSWRLQPNGGGVLLQRTYHAIDLLRYLLADEIATIYTAATQQILGDRSAQRSEQDAEQPKSRSRAVEEEAHSLVRLRHHGFITQIHDSFFIPHNPTLFEFYGSQGTLQIEHWADPTVESRLWLLRNQSIQQLPTTPASPDRQMIFAFTQQIRSQTNQQPPSLLATAEAGIRALAVVVAARQSLWEQRPVTLAQSNV